MTTFTETERQEFQRLMEYTGPCLSRPDVYGALLRAEDARLVALMAGRDAGLLSEGDYFEEVEAMCNGDFRGLHSRRIN